MSLEREHGRERPTSLDGGVVFERGSKRLEGLHVSALQGAKLLTLLHESPDADFETFQSRVGVGHLPAYAERHFRAIIDRWRVLRENNASFMHALKERAGGDDASQRKIIRALFEARGCSLPIGNVSIEHRGAYIIVSCSNDEDYRALYSGRTSVVTTINSTGTYHRKMTFEFKTGLHDLESEKIDWDPESGEPPPLVDESYDSDEPPPLPDEENVNRFTAPVLLAKTGSSYGLDTVVAHEEQHFINGALAGIYGHETIGCVSSDTKLKDEILAGIREGASPTVLYDRLAHKYDHFLKETPEEKRAHEAVLSALRNALNQPLCRSLCSSLEGRTVIAFHLMHLPLEKIPERIGVLLSFFRERLPIAPIEEDPKNFPPDPAQLKPYFSVEEWNIFSNMLDMVAERYREYEKSVQGLILSERPTRDMRNDVLGRVSAYQVELDQFMRYVVSRFPAIFLTELIHPRDIRKSAYIEGPPPLDE